MRNRSFVIAILSLLVLLVPPGQAQADLPKPIPTTSVDPPNAYMQAVLSDHPSAYYRLDETSGTIAHDSSGAGYDATYTGSQYKLGQPGIFGGSSGDTAVYLAGDSGYVSTGNQGTPLPALQGNHDRTVELWFKTSQAGDQNLFHTGASGHVKAFDISLVGSSGPGACRSQSSSGLYVRFWDDDLHLTGLQLADSQWHYVAVTVFNSGASVNIVLDGRQPSGYVWDGHCYTTSPKTQPFSLAYPIDTTASAIGIGTSGWRGGLSGDVDEVAIYPSALSVSELSAHYRLVSAKSSGLAVVVHNGTCGLQLSTSDGRTWCGDSLSTDNSPHQDEQVMAVFTIRNTSNAAIAIKRLIAGGRGPGGQARNWDAPNVDWPPASLTLQPGEQYEYRQSRTFSDLGDYFAEPVYQDGNDQWHGITPYSRVTFRVVVAPPQPGPYPPVPPTPTPILPCYPINPPKVVVVMLMGLNSSLPDPQPNPYDPLKEGQCAVLQYGKNPVLKQLAETFDTTGEGSNGPTLMTSLAGTGAVILPFSYQGAVFENRSTGLFRVIAYDNHVPNNADINVEARVLDIEVESIRQKWSQVKIVVIGHSEGGLIAKQWWRNFPESATKSKNIAGVFTLDAPINGASNPLGMMQSLGAKQDCTSSLPCNTLASDMAKLWLQDALKDHDDIHMALEAKKEGRGIFWPIGTRGDAVMELAGAGDPCRPNELAFQLLTYFNSDCGDVKTYLEPGRITPGNYSGHLGIFGLETHGIVYRHPDNIAWLTQQVQDAALGQSDIPALAARLGTSSYRSTFDPVSLLLGPHLASTYALPSVQSATPTVQLALTTSLQLPTGPVVQLSSPVVAPGGILTITGSGLGAAPGQVGIVSLIGGMHAITGSIVGWSDTKVTLTVPPGATSGLLIGVTGAGASFNAGFVTVLEQSSPVAALQATAPPTAPIDGLSAEIVVMASNSQSQPAAIVPIHLSDGLTVLTQTTDASGKASFQLRGYGAEHLIAFSGTAWTALDVTWNLPSPVEMTLSPSSTHPQHGEPIELSALVHDAQGHPIPNVPVMFEVAGPATTTLNPAVSTTDAAGRAVATVTNTEASAVVVGASTNYGFVSDSILIDWGASQTPLAPNTSDSGPNALLLVLLVLAFFSGILLVLAVFYYRRRARLRHHPGGARRDGPNRLQGRNHAVADCRLQIVDCRLTIP